MADTIPITKHLADQRRFWQFGREERDAVAVLFALLAQGDNLRRFCAHVGWDPGDLGDVEFHVEWTYLRDLWWAAGFALRPETVEDAPPESSPERARKVILDALQPANRSELEQGVCSVYDFNCHFGAVPQPSRRFIQSPGNWSIARFSPNIADHGEFVRTCKFKWAFNVKPDLVLQTSTGRVLCVEAKLESGEGVYPAGAVEKAIFAQRGLPFVRQTEVQQHLVQGLLGFDGTFRYLTRGAAVGGGVVQTIRWAEVLQSLDTSGVPSFMQAWIEQEMRRSRSS